MFTMFWTKPKDNGYRIIFTQLSSNDVTEYSKMLTFDDYIA